MARHPDPDLIALGIRQPWAELIVRGLKTVEVRRIDTVLRGPIYVYSAKKVSDHPAALRAAAAHRLDLDSLPRGKVVGTVEIASTGPITPDDAVAACLSDDELAATGGFGWRLAAPHKFATPLAVRFLPYGIWFYPFRRRTRA